MSEDYKIYDLIYAISSFIIFCIGISFLQKRKGINLIIFFTTFFIVYQVLGWTLTTPRYLSHIKLSNSSDLLLVPHDGGAFTASSFVNLEVSKKYGLLFRRRTSIKSYDGIRSGKLLPQDDKFISVELMTYSNNELYDIVNIKQILNGRSL